MGPLASEVPFYKASQKIDKFDVFIDDPIMIILAKSSNIPFDTMDI